MGNPIVCSSVDAAPPRSRPSLWSFARRTTRPHPTASAAAAARGSLAVRSNVRYRQWTLQQIAVLARRPSPAAEIQRIGPPPVDTTPTGSTMKIGAFLFPLLPLCRSGILRELKAIVMSWKQGSEMRSTQNYDEGWITVTPLHHWDRNALVGQTRRIEAVVGERNVVRRSGAFFSRMLARRAHGLRCGAPSPGGLRDLVDCVASRADRTTTCPGARRAFQSDPR